MQGVDFDGSALTFSPGKPKRGSQPKTGKRTRSKGGDTAASGVTMDIVGEPSEATPSTSSRGKAGDSAGADQKKRDAGNLLTVQLNGFPVAATKEQVQNWVEEQLPGGCG